VTVDVDICNRALSEIGARVLITSIAQPQGTAAIQCALHYQPVRQQLLRTAPWGFCRKTGALSQLGSVFTTPPTSDYPWFYKYAYPADCMKARYMLCPPPTPIAGVAPIVGLPVGPMPYGMPSRSNRYLVSNDDSSGVDATVIYSNVCGALLVYNKDVQSPDRWDSLFTDAMVAALKNKIVLGVTGNAGMKQTFAQECEIAIAKARAADGNEAIARVDHTPDWISTRGAFSPYGYSTTDFNGGFWNAQWDSMSWGS
jgi:hypothetical protein